MRKNLKSVEEVKEAMRLEISKMCEGDYYNYEARFAASALLYQQMNAPLNSGEFLKDDFKEGLKLLLALAQDKEENHLYEIGIEADAYAQVVDEITEEYIVRKVGGEEICKVR